MWQSYLRVVDYISTIIILDACIYKKKSTSGLSITQGIKVVFRTNDGWHSTDQNECGGHLELKERKG